MDDFNIINLEELTNATALNQTDLIAIAQGAKSLNKLTIQALASFIGVNASVKVGDKNTTPTQASFAFAEQGTYTNWGGQTITSDLGILIFDGTDYNKTEINFIANGVVEKGNEKAVNGGNIFNTLSQRNDSVDITPFLTLTNDSYIEPGNGNVFPAGDWKATNYIDISDFDTLETNSNINHYYAYYDVNKVYIGGSTILTTLFKKPLNAHYIRMTITNNAFYLKLHKSGLLSVNKLNLKYSKSGFYINATNGNKEVLSSYSYSDFIPVKNGDIVRYQDTTVDYVDPKHVAIFNSNLQYVSGNTSTNIINISQDGFIIFSTETTNVDKTVLTINNSNLVLNNAVDVVLNKENIKGLSNPYIVTVGKNGGDFSTINEAINYLKDITTEVNKGVIYLLSGTYKEVVNIAPYHIDIAGINRDTCIILDDTGIYANSPINISGRNSLSNLTALATNPNGNTPAIWAYALHADHEGEGKSYINNCRFFSEVNAGIGLGTQNNQQYEFNNCVIETINTDTFKGSLYMHNSPYAGDTNMSVLVRNCIVKATKEYSLIIDDANENAGHNDDTGTTFTFVNNMLWSDINGKTDSSIRFSNAPTTGDIGQIKIGLQSYGNNVNKINK